MLGIRIFLVHVFCCSHLMLYFFFRMVIHKNYIFHTCAFLSFIRYYISHCCWCFPFFVQQRVFRLYTFALVTHVMPKTAFCFGIVKFFLYSSSLCLFLYPSFSLLIHSLLFVVHNIKDSRQIATVAIAQAKHVRYARNQRKTPMQKAREYEENENRTNKTNIKTKTNEIKLENIKTRYEIKAQNVCLEYGKLNTVHTHAKCVDTYTHWHRKDKENELLSDTTNQKQKQKHSNIFHQHRAKEENGSCVVVVGRWSSSSSPTMINKSLFHLFYDCNLHEEKWR